MAMLGWCSGCSDGFCCAPEEEWTVAHSVLLALIHAEMMTEQNITIRAKLALEESLVEHLPYDSSFSFVVADRSYFLRSVEFEPQPAVY